MKKLTLEEIVNRSRKVHGMKYYYNSSVYNGMLTKMTIVCPIHGPFEQRPTDHIREKHGCPKCAHNFEVTKDEFVKRSQKKFGNKFTIVSDYAGFGNPITLCCKDHGNFDLSKASAHLINGGGCPKCAHMSRIDGLRTGNISKAETDWLDSLNITLRQYKIHINDKIYVVDGFDLQTNTIYEYYGSYWHGNPEVYDLNSVNTMKNVTFGDLYNRTLERERILSEYYTVITKWSDR